MQEIEITQLRTLVDIVKKHYDYDFANYAMSSFRRRIQRIIELYKFSSIEALCERLSTGDEKFFHDFLFIHWKLLLFQSIIVVQYN